MKNSELTKTEFPEFPESRMNNIDNVCVDEQTNKQNGFFILEFLKNVTFFIFPNRNSFLFFAKIKKNVTLNQFTFYRMTYSTHTYLIPGSLNFNIDIEYTE